MVIGATHHDELTTHATGLARNHRVILVAHVRAQQRPTIPRRPDEVHKHAVQRRAQGLPPKQPAEAGLLN